ncbi:hypothetical protein T12_7350 [Trichinella patagoniensis]|uniref:Uncharacterized protein n=1 Tax=Trichinella patagoniensis TaxID=990121 RepID=A0A0V0WQQ8_9BILA|nr:hypothetical protein T12_7350 [Trichinella patagoniensis]
MLSVNYAMHRQSSYLVERDFSAVTDFQATQIKTTNKVAWANSCQINLFHTHN